MTPEAAKALEESIAHWERMVSGERQRSRAGFDIFETPFAGDCPLCALYLHKGGGTSETSCCGCPVRKATGRDSCEETPWENAADAFRDSPVEPKTYLTWEFKKAAQAELDFLISLRPK